MTDSKEKRGLSDSLERFWKDLERNAEDRVRRAISRFRIPRREELAELEIRAERLTGRVNTLATRR